jgi:hypothetical protein
LSILGRETGQKIDVLLLPYLQATDESESQRQLALIISVTAEPIIKEIISYKLRVSFNPSALNRQNQDAEDIYSEALVEVLTQLRESKANPDGRPINNLRSYVATITYHICYEYLRKIYPQRSHLKDRLRYLLTHHQSFAMWESENERHCGFAVWKDQKRAIARAGQLQQLYSEPQSSRQPVSAIVETQNTNLADLVAGIFNKAGRPVELDALVNIAATLLGIKDQRKRDDTEDKEINDLSENLPDPRAGIDIELDQRNYLQQLWLEISQLSPRQCASLLLNLKDVQGRGVIVLFILLGIATIDQIAKALAISLEKFTELWNELPIDDSSIAGYLGVTRQQVINLRKSARERLERRMKAFD